MSDVTSSLQTANGGITRFLPIAGWLPQYDRSWFRPDLIAGLTVAAVGCAQVVGIRRYCRRANPTGSVRSGRRRDPVRHLRDIAPERNRAQFCLGCGRGQRGPCCRRVGRRRCDHAGGLRHARVRSSVLLLALFKMGWISQFLSKAVIIGFLFGSAIEVVIGELPKVTGTTAEGSNSWQKLFSWLIYISTTPHMPVLGRQPGTQAFRGVADHPDDETYPGLLVLRFDAGLFFASADALTDRLRELVQQADPPVQTVVLDFEGVNFVDSQGSAKVAEILDLATSYGIDLRLARVKASVTEVLKRDGVIDRLGEDHIYGNVYEAVADQIPVQPNG